MVKFQSANLGDLQRGLVPDLGVDGDFNFIRIQRIGVILIKPDSTVGKWTMGVEEKSAIGEREFESGVGGVLWPMRAPVWGMRFVRMTGSMGVTGLVRMTGFMRVVRLMWVAWLVGMIGSEGVTRGMRRLGFIRIVGFAVTVMMSLPTMMVDLLWLRPLSILIAFQGLFQIKRSLCCVLAIQDL